MRSAKSIGFMLSSSKKEFHAKALRKEKPKAPRRHFGLWCLDSLLPIDTALRLLSFFSSRLCEKTE
jgi:hypothetical protein